MDMGVQQGLLVLPGLEPFRVWKTTLAPNYTFNSTDIVAVKSRHWRVQLDKLTFMKKIIPAAFLIIAFAGSLFAYPPWPDPNSPKPPTTAQITSR